MPRYLVERSFPDGLHVPSGDEGRDACASVIEQNARVGVTWITSYVSLDLRKSFCVYDGPSPEAVRVAAARTNLPVERISAVRVLDPYYYQS